MARTPKKLKHFILDVDGVLTDGSFHYTEGGKAMKRFGPDDHDAILLLQPHMEVLAISGDKKGFHITKKRVEEDMGLALHQVSTHDRAAWIKERYNPEEVVYMGDGIFDAKVFVEVGYAIAPANAFPRIKEHADYVTTAAGGNGAVAEACFHLMENFFLPLDVLTISLGKGGEWGATK